MADVQSVAVNQLQLRALLRDDPEFFIQFFMNEQLTFPVPPFHIEVFGTMTHANVSRLALAIARAHAKTTLCKLAAVHYLLFSDFRFVLYVTGSADLVVPYVNDIISFMECDNFKRVFGPLDFARPGMRRQDGNGVYKFYIPALDKVCILRGIGAGQRVRGLNVDNERPQLAIVDDAENDDDVDTAAAHMKMMRWWYGPFIKCLNPVKNKVIASGNLISKNSVLYKLLHSEQWVSYIYGALLSDGTPLWPDVWNVEKLRQDFAEYQANGMAAKWFSEMLNQPVNEAGDIITTGEILYLPAKTPEEIEYGFVTMDLACSKQRWADNAAIAAHGWDGERAVWQIVETFTQRGVDTVDLFNRALKMAARWNVRVIAIEGGSMQTAIINVFQYLLNLRNLQNQFIIIGIGAGGVAKARRIMTWASMLKQSDKRKATYALTEGEFIVTQQLLDYQPTVEHNKDDLIDCCAYGPQVVARHMQLVLQDLPDRTPLHSTPLARMASC